MIKQIFRHFTFLIKRFFPQWRHYGFFLAFWSFAFGFKRALPERLKLFLAIQKHKHILHYLFLRYSPILDYYNERSKTPETAITSESTIWVCWWDGENVMPPLVKACYNSIKIHSGAHPVKLITKDNFSSYVSIPKYILEKLETGIMTLTHFSNILRINLLHDHGGIWIDSTILALRDISLSNLPFYTLKTTNKTYNVSHIVLEGPSYVYSGKNIPEINNWSGFLLAGTKHSLIFAYLRDILYAYWKEHDDQIDYLLFDYTIALGYGNIPVVKKTIDNVPCLDYDKNSLEKKLNSIYCEKNNLQIYSQTFYKLNWKKKYKIFIHGKKPTNYGHILNAFG